MITKPHISKDALGAIVNALDSIFASYYCGNCGWQLSDEDHEDMVALVIESVEVDD